MCKLRMHCALRWLWLWVEEKNRTEIPTMFSVCQAFAKSFNTNRMRTSNNGNWKAFWSFARCYSMKISFLCSHPTKVTMFEKFKRIGAHWSGMGGTWREGCKYRITACREPSIRRQGHFGEFSRRNDWHWTLYRFRDYMNINDNDDFIDTHKRKKKLMRGCGERDNATSNVNNNIFIHWMRINFAFCECQTMIPLNFPGECEAHWNSETRLLLEYLSCACTRLSPYKFSSSCWQPSAEIAFDVNKCSPFSARARNALDWHSGTCRNAHELLQTGK